MDNLKILDCTLRDGGYYTNWDFDSRIVQSYIQAINHLPLDYLEIGYRSNQMDGYSGEFFHCPVYVMEELKTQTNKHLAIMLNEKDVKATDIKALLDPCKGLIDMVRLAIDPKNFKRALGLAEEIKNNGFEVGLNVMYMSKWSDQKDFIELIKEVGDTAEYLCMVDSYGGVYPEDVIATYELIKSKSDVKIGFHGHNNLELALINTLTAIKCGASIVDTTVTGMGRGAGNLKTELLLTALHSKGLLDIDFNELSKLVDPFVKLQEAYGWGTNLPYMVSGANSLPQKDVMEWVTKRYYSLNSIIRALSNQSMGVKDNIDLKKFVSDKAFNAALIIGGGPSGGSHSKAINEFLCLQDNICLIHASSKNAVHYSSVKQPQYHCLSGNEGHRLESTFNTLPESERVAILPPYPRSMGTYLPEFFHGKAYQLELIDFTESFKESVTALAIQIALNMNVKTIYFVGYDGYPGNISNNELDLFNENIHLFNKLAKTDLKFVSLTATEYKSMPVQSVYGFLP